MSAEDIYIEEEEAQTRGQGYKLLPRVWPFFRKYLDRTIVAAVLLIGSAVLGLAAPLLVKHAIDVNIPNKDVRGLVTVGLIYLVLQMAIGAAGFFQQVLLAIIGENAIADLKHTLSGHIVRLPASFFDRNPVGRLISRVESDSSALQEMFSSTAVTLARNLVMLVGMSVVMLVVNWRLFLVIAGLFPVTMVGFYLLQKRSRPLYLQMRRIVAEINNFITETMRSLPVVQAFNRQDYFAGRMDEKGRRLYGIRKQEMFIWTWIWLVWDFGEMSGVALTLGIGGLFALKGQLTVGGLFLFYSYITRFFVPIRAVSEQIHIMQRAFASAERMLGILDTAPEPDGEVQLEAGDFQRALRFDAVELAYEGRGTVLKDINLEVRKGEKVALVGETGGGKTSLASLALKFYEPKSGRILLDGAELPRIRNQSLRRLIGFVPQDVILFPGTVLDNLRLFDDTVSETRVHDAARRARMHERILQLPQGYATSVIERGVNLSLGERQLLAFTRALVLDPEILILDEATSSVDPHTEHLIQQGLEELLKGRTAIIIAHRLATIRMVDRIVVVHGGRIVQEGTHDDLVAQDGYYSRLYKLQYLAQEQT
jgi:ATP-binding cassette, subfamily B, multidrug efflux pump